MNAVLETVETTDVKAGVTTVGIETIEAETDASTIARADVTIAVTETTEAETDASTTATKAAELSQPTTIGLVRNATIPTLPAARSATAAKSPDLAVAASAATVVDGTTGDSETIVVDETIADSETTVVETDASMIGREVVTTGAVETTAGPSEATSTTTTGLARSVTTPTSRSETSATGAKPPDLEAGVAAVNEVEVALPTAVNATTDVRVAGTETIVVIEAATDAPPTAASAAEETEGSEMADAETVVTEDKVALRAAEAMDRAEDEVHNAVAPPMEASEGPKASVPAMPITVHHVISEHLVPLNGRKTERT